MTVDVRKGQGDVKLTREEFERRLRERFYDPEFEKVERTDRRRDRRRVEGLRRVPQEPAHAKGRTRLRQSRFRAAGRMARDARAHSARRSVSTTTPAAAAACCSSCGAARHDQTCPGEMSKTFRLASLAREEVERAGVECDFLDLSLLTAQYGRQILPCKACVSTAMPLCHWPCSCYPNHAMGQVNDWMNELYPRWVAAHGVMIVTPGVLVSGAERAEADDRSPRLRRRRQPRSDDDAREGREGGEGARARRLALSAPPRRPRLRRRRPWRCGGRGDAAPIAERLAVRHEAAAGDAARRHRSLHRLLRAVRDEPRRARSKTRPCSRRSATQRRPSSKPSRSIAPAASRIRSPIQIRDRSRTNVVSGFRRTGRGDRSVRL